MNLLGAIGTLMDDTGLTNIMEVVYGDNASIQLMTGKSVHRSFRGYLLVNNCRNNMIVSAIVNENPEFASLFDQSEDITLPCWQTRPHQRVLLHRIQLPK